MESQSSAMGYLLQPILGISRIRSHLPRHKVVLSPHDLAHLLKAMLHVEINNDIALTFPIGLAKDLGESRASHRRTRKSGRESDDLKNRRPLDALIEAVSVKHLQGSCRFLRGWQNDQWSWEVLHVGWRTRRPPSPVT